MNIKYDGWFVVYLVDITDDIFLSVMNLFIFLVNAELWLPLI